MTGPSIGPSLSCVVLTRGDRPREVQRAIDSVVDQHGPPIEVLLVINGSSPHTGGALPAVVTVVLDENSGIPGGRNRGIVRTAGEAIIFLDDDGWLPDRGTAQRLAGMFDADPRLGIVSFRIVDPLTGRTQRRHVPRIRVGDPERSSDVTTFLGGACAVRREVFDRCGDLPAAFFYGHEESDLAWRALDAGFRIRYDAGSLMYHPVSDPAERHSAFYRHQGRNRVWLARRRLPRPLVPLYLGAWMVLTVVRVRRAPALRAWFSGFVEGWREHPGERSPISWRTVGRMTALGRPPLL